jgi:hypothetical protein
VARAEIVGLAPRAALEGFPTDIPLPDFDPERQVIETSVVPVGEPIPGVHAPATPPGEISGEIKTPRLHPLIHSKPLG